MCKSNQIKKKKKNRKKYKKKRKNTWKKHKNVYTVNYTFLGPSLKKLSYYRIIINLNVSMY